MDCDVGCQNCLGGAYCCGGRSDIDANELAILAEAAQASRDLAIGMHGSTADELTLSTLGSAEILAVLFGKFLRYNNQDSSWIDRDRLILSSFRVNPLLYAWLHLAGCGISLEDLMEFRDGNAQAEKRAEFCKNIGAECTVCHLGQEIGTAVGVAMSQRLLADRLQSDKHILQCRTICLLDYTCMLEEISLESLSLAGARNLGNLILICEDNRSICNEASQLLGIHDFSPTLRSLGWQVQQVDGRNVEALIDSLLYARAFPNGKPQIIIAKIIEDEGVEAPEWHICSHAISKKSDALCAASKNLCAETAMFDVPENVRAHFSVLTARRNWEYAHWQERFALILERHDDISLLLFPEKFRTEHMLDLAADFTIEAGTITETIRRIFSELSAKTPNLISLNADIFSSTEIMPGNCISFQNACERECKMQCETRECAIATIANGLAYGEIFRPLVATFHLFSDRILSIISAAAMANLPVIYVLTNGKSAVGNDLSAIRQAEILPSLCEISNLIILKPADNDEAVGVMAYALCHQTCPTALVLPRQTISRHASISVKDVRKGASFGAYIAQMESDALHTIVLASGTDLQIALEAAMPFKWCRIVSMPSMEIFEMQPKEYCDSVLPKNCLQRIAIVESALPSQWRHYIRPDNIITIDLLGVCDGKSHQNGSFAFCVSMVQKQLKRFENSSYTA
jgi:transketolase